MLSADDVQFGDAAAEVLARLVEDLVDRERIGVDVAFAAREGAEEAAVGTDVGVVDVPVADEVDVVADRATAGDVGHRAERDEVAAGEQALTVGETETLAGRDLRPDVGEVCKVGEAGDVVVSHGQVFRDEPGLDAPASQVYCMVTVTVTAPAAAPARHP